METNDDVLIELDPRRRAYLGRVGLAEHTRYVAHTEPDGTVTLSPAVVTTEHDLKLMARPDVLDTIAEARQHPEKLIRGRRRPASKDE